MKKQKLPEVYCPSCALFSTLRGHYTITPGWIIDWKCPRCQTEFEITISYQQVYNK
jgi:transposase-like protein